MKTAKKLFALLLVVSLLATMFAMGVAAEGSAQIVSQQLSLGDDLTMRFGVAVDSQYPNAEISVSVAGSAKTYNVAELTAKDGIYTVSVELAAAQMTDAITVTVTDGETQLVSKQYSVQAYCQYLLNGDYTDATKQMVLEVLNYGTKAQLYFDYNRTNLANAGNELETVATVPTEGYDLTTEGGVSGITFHGASLVFQGKIAVRYYFSASDISGYTFTVNGVPYETQENQDGLFYVEVPGINPQQYADMIHLTVSDGIDSLVVGYSPLSYIVRMYAKDTTSATLKDLLVAMYSYYLEARSFTGVQVKDDRVELPVHIIGHEVIGQWKDNKEGSASLGAVNSYDGNITGKDANDANDMWNPAVTDFMSGEGIIYTLDNTYDVTGLVMYCQRIFYFTLYGSADGETFTQIARVGSSNAADFYTGEVGSYVCELGEINGANAKYLKLVFTGCANIDATHVAVFEVELTGKKPMAVNDGRVEMDAVIISHTIEGTWLNSREDTSDSAAKTYDGDTTSKWNPNTSNFVKGEAIVYTLERLTDLTDVTVTFGTRQVYFDLSISADGKTFTHVARVNAATASNYFTDLAASVENINKPAKYIRLDFLGTAAAGQTWITVMEVEVDGKAPEAPKIEGVELDAIIVDHALDGAWTNDQVTSTSANPAKSYDGDTNTRWNPNGSSGFTKGEAIIYTLDSEYTLTDVTVTVGTRKPYFDLSVSTDGVNFTHAARVNAVTASRYYNDQVCTVDGIYANAKYIRLDFLGTSDKGTWLEIFEVAVDGIVVEKEADTREDVPYTIIDGAVAGDWVNPQIGDSKAGHQLSFDGNPATFWNPQAATSFAGTNQIVYTLDKAYDLDKIVLTSAKREYYFDVSISGNGIDYTHVARVNAQTASRYYNGLVATIENIGASGIKYVKVNFIGSANNSTFVAFAEVEFGCKAYEADTTNAVSATIVGNEVVGTWVNNQANSASVGPQKTYDGNLTGGWNAQVTNFKSGEGVIYTLDRAYDLTQLKLTFGTRKHYFDVYVSADGVTYVPVAFINADNAAEYYDGLVATLDNLTNTDVVYIKVLFTGSEDASKTFINLFESEATGK